jgi:hypothetical protein
LFVRGSESVRIVVDGGSVEVHGPGNRVTHSHFGEAMDATLHQADVEHHLVVDGWSLEQLTTERRAAVTAPYRGSDRRGALRLVHPNRS